MGDGLPKAVYFNSRDSITTAGKANRAQLASGNPPADGDNMDPENLCYLFSGPMLRVVHLCLFRGFGILDYQDK